MEGVGERVGEILSLFSPPRADLQTTLIECDILTALAVSLFPSAWKC